MKLKLDFVTKLPKVAKDNEVILLKDKSIKNKELIYLNKSLFSDKLFTEKKFLIKNKRVVYIYFLNIFNIYFCKNSH